jgi:hypothetical protein
MRKVLKDGAILCQQLIQQGFPVILITAPQNMMMGPSHDLNGVELNEPKLLDERQQIQAARWRGAQPNGCKPKSPRVFIFDLQKTHGIASTGLGATNCFNERFVTRVWFLQNTFV